MSEKKGAVAIKGASRAIARAAIRKVLRRTGMVRLLMLTG